MGNMLKFELRKLLRKPSLYIMSAIVVGISVFSVFSMRGLMNLSSYMDGYVYDDSFKETFVSLLSPQKLVLNELWLFLSMVLAIFSGIFVCEDRVRGTIKNIYARGYSRTNVFLAKFIISSAIAALLYLLVIVSLYVSGTIALATAPFEVVPQKVSGFWLLLLGRLLVLLAANAGYFMISEFIGSTGISIAFNFFAPQIANGILYFFMQFLFYIVLRNVDFDKSGIIMGVSEYWIYLLFMGGFYIDMEVDTYVWHMIASGIYLIVFTLLGWLIARKKEVKN